MTDPIIICPFCGKNAEWVENKEVYGKNYGKSYMMWLCRPCKAYVGCHENTKQPLGTLANKALREWRVKAHSAFDVLWKSGTISRNEAYRALSKEFGRHIHIGESNIEQCQAIIRVSENLAKKPANGPDQTPSK